MALVVKNLPANAGDIRDVGFIPGFGKFSGEGSGYPLQYFCLENPTDRGAWWATDHGAAELDTTEAHPHSKLYIKSHILWASYIIFLMHLKIDV